MQESAHHPAPPTNGAVPGSDVEPPSPPAEVRQSPPRPEPPRSEPVRPDLPWADHQRTDQHRPGQLRPDQLRTDQYRPQPLPHQPPQQQPPRPEPFEHEPLEHQRLESPRPGAELTDEAILRPRVAVPEQGWRRVLHRGTAGLVNPGPGEAELHRHDLVHRLRRPVAGTHRIAVTSIKGGVGKTTVTTCLGLALAEHRGDRVVVLDANPDAGTLADRLTGESSVTVRELLRDLHRVESWADITRYTSLAGRLQVLASEQDPASSDAFSRDEYERICALLGRYFNLVITDSGTGLVHSAMEGTLRLADSLIVVGAPTVDGASRASKTLDWLVAHGFGDLTRSAIVVLSCDRRSDDVDVVRIREHFAARTRAVVEVPHDPHLATGGRVEFARMHRRTQDAFLELAALVADRFGGVPPIAPAPRVGAPGVLHHHRGEHPGNGPTLEG